MIADYLYVCTQGCNLTKHDNRLLVIKNDKVEKDFPLFPLKVIELYGNIQVSSALVKHCLQNGVIIAYYTMAGSFYGMLSGPDTNQSIKGLKAQVEIQKNIELCLALAKTIIRAKIHNQETLLRRYDHKDLNNFLAEDLSIMDISSKKIETSNTTSSIMGYEGNAARVYFSRLGQLVEKAFAFSIRSRRPAKDPVNALLNLGYSMLCREITGKIQSLRLNPALGILHASREGKYALAYDLMEEWRPVIVDSLSASLQVFDYFYCYLYYYCPYDSC